MSELDELDKLMTALRAQVIEDASKIDPSIKTDLEADLAEIGEHQKALDAQRAKKQEVEPAAKELLDLANKMIETAPRPK